MVRYLEFYHGVSSYSAYSGSISDISLDKLTLSCGGRSFATKLTPPMTSFRDARERLVEMDQVCNAGLGRSDITIKEFPPLKGINLLLNCTAAMTLIAFSLRSNFAATGIIARLVPEAFRQFCWTTQPYVFYGILLIHTTEVIYLVRSRLAKHNINVRDTLFWRWAGDCFLEGVGAFDRFVNVAIWSSLDLPHTDLTNWSRRRKQTRRSRSTRLSLRVCRNCTLLTA